MPFSHVAADLLLAAEVYLSLGWSVIPLYGNADPSRPKVAAIPWSIYQSRRALLSQARYWFIEQGFLGIGIVTGRISNLLILDFDDPELFQRFQALCSPPCSFSVKPAFPIRKVIYAVFQVNIFEPHAIYVFRLYGTRIYRIPRDILKFGCERKV